MTDADATPYENMVATTAMQQLIDDEPDRFTGMWMDGPQGLVLSVVDRTALDEPAYARVCDAARDAGMEITVVTGARSRSELDRINEEILRTPLEPLGAHGYGWSTDPVTATIRIEVGAVAADAVRAAFAHHGDAVVVVASPPADLTPRHAQGTPLMELVGLPTEPTAERLRTEGFHIEIHHLGHPIALSMNLRSDRIRLFVHDGLIRDASQG